MKPVLISVLLVVFWSTSLLSQDEAAISAAKDVSSLLVSKVNTSPKSLAQTLITSVAKKHGNNSPHPALKQAVVQAIQLHRSKPVEGEIKGFVDDIYAYSISLIILAENRYEPGTDSRLCKKRKDELQSLLKRLSVVIKSLVDCENINRDQYLRLPGLTLFLREGGNMKNCSKLGNELKDVLKAIDFASREVAWICD